MNSKYTVSTKKPDWLPDWEDATQYPDPKTTSLRQWAWEFLRRNLGYQQLWAKLEALPGPVGFIYYENFTKMEKRLQIQQRFEKKFGVHNPAPPSMASTDPTFEWRPRFVTRHVKYWMKPVDWPEEFYVIDEALRDPAEAMISFNLHLPLRSQLDGVEKLLKDRVAHLTSLGVLKGRDRRMKPQHFQGYLRLLDAEATDASQKEMAKVIYNIVDKYPDHAGEQKARDGLERAKWLRDKGYQFIAVQTQFIAMSSQA